MEEYIRDKFENGITDTRNQSYVTHRLSDILMIVMCAVFCGCDQLEAIVEFAKSRIDMLREHFGIVAIPSKATFSRILNMIDGASVAAIIIEIMKEKTACLGRIIAVDGKAIRSTAEKGKPHSALQILSAYMVENGVVLGQATIHEKTNEIPVFQEMLEHIDIKGKTITADALHCQRETCRKIVDPKHKGDYVFGLKENQRTLFVDVKLFFDDEINAEEIETATDKCKNGGRIEIRICSKAKDVEWLAEHKWPGLRSVFAIRRIVTCKGKTTDETSYYISSLDRSPAELLHIARAHWMIESLHWMMDVDFKEDECELLSENGQETLNAFRKIALMLHRRYIKSLPKNKRPSAKTSLLRALIRPDWFLEVIGSL